MIDFFLSILSRLFVRLATKKSSSAIAVEALEIEDEGLEVEMLPAIDIGGSLLSGLFVLIFSQFSQIFSPERNGHTNGGFSVTRFDYTGP